MKDVSIEVRTSESIPMHLLLLADPSEDQVQNYLKNSKLFFAKHKEEIIGVLALVEIDTDCLEIKNVAVDPNFQRKGIGSTLLRFAIGFARSSTSKKLIIGTADTSTKQLSLYQRLGFSISGEIKDFFLDHYDEAIFENGKQAKDMIRLELSLS